MLIRAVLHRSLNYIAERSLFSTNHRGAENTESEEKRRSHAEDFAGDRFFNKPQRKKRSHAEDFTGDRFF
ncbi:MAG: hypothetical protein ACYTXC_09930 [Nostoc sp.]